MKSKIIESIKFIRLFVIKISSTNRIFSRLFFLFDNSFDREFEYTLRGRYEALSSRYTNDGSNANLRRNIHRLEKGIFHKNRKRKFGNEVMNEINREVTKIEINSIDSNELDWSLKTLKEYLPFAYQPEDTEYCIKVLESGYREKSSELPNKLASDKYTMLLEIYKERKSVRYFQEEAIINTDDILLAVEAAKLAPSACNRQPFSIHILQEKSDIMHIGGLAPGTAGFLDNIPTLVVVVGHASSFRFARDRHLIYTDSGIFIGNFLPALTALGLSSCVLNWVPDWKNDRAAIKYLDLDMSKSIVCLIAIGYGDPKYKSPVSTKKALNTLVKLH